MMMIFTPVIGVPFSIGLRKLTHAAMTEIMPVYTELLASLSREIDREIYSNVDFSGVAFGTDDGGNAVINGNVAGAALQIEGSRERAEIAVLSAIHYDKWDECVALLKVVIDKSSPAFKQDPQREIWINENSDSEFWNNQNSAEAWKFVGNFRKVLAGRS